MSRLNLTLVPDRFFKWLWALFLISLPVTSFPYFPSGFGGTTLVRPLSVYPLIVLGLLFILPRIFDRKLPRNILPLIAFGLVAVISTALGFLRGIEPIFDVTLTSRSIRTLVTFLLGVAIYITVTSMIESRDDLRFSMRWLYVGLMIALLWGSLQAAYIILDSPDWFSLMRKLQKMISIRRLFRDRVSGLTYEPNWFADQIVFLYLPFLLGSILRGYTVFRLRWRWLTVEWAMIVWAIALLPFTFSRAGMVILLVLVTAALLFFRRSKPGISSRKKHLGKFFRHLALVGLVIVILIGLTQIASTRNKFFARIWDYWERSDVSIEGYFYYLGFGARFTYWQAGYNIFASNPLLGVGLGNYAFFFEDMMPYFFYARQPEVLKVITPEPGRSLLITPKNYFIRLLSETGLVGTTMFLTFLIGLVGMGLHLWLGKDSDSRYWGTASLLGLIAFGLDAFSFDSFAIPNMWVVFGLITAASQVFISPLTKSDDQLSKAEGGSSKKQVNGTLVQEMEPDVIL